MPISTLGLSFMDFFASDVEIFGSLSQIGAKTSEFGHYESVESNGQQILPRLY